MIEKILAQCGRGTIVSSLAGLSDFKPTSLMALDIETFGADKLPGDSPYSPLHGICGLAVANAEGDARYILVDDSGGKRPGVPVAELAEYANRSWLTKDRTIIFHNAKFDLGFLMARGFEFGTVNLQDTWILHSILCKGVFVSNRLKDIMKARFGISVVSEEVLKKWLADHGTMDYGEIPAELIGPYACDDVRYALALLVSLCTSGIEDWVHVLHRKYLRASLRLIAAEAEGFSVDVAKIKQMMAAAQGRVDFHLGVLRDLMKSVNVEITDDQAMLAHMHMQNLHPGRNDFFGELKYYFDRDALSRLEHPLAVHYRSYYIYRTFMEQWGSRNALKTRVTVADGQAVVHPSYLLSIFSKGGVVQCKRPDLHSVLTLTDSARALVKPRPDQHLVQVQIMDLPMWLLAYYMKDKGFQDLVAVRSGLEICRHFVKPSGLSPEAVSLIFNQIIFGYGDARLVERLLAHNIRVSKSDLGALRVKLMGQLPKINDFKKRLLSALDDSGGSCRDVMGSQLTILPDKRYRAPALLISSGAGNILSAYLLKMCECADRYGAKLIFVRENEFLFEAPAGCGLGAKLQDEVLKHALCPVVPGARVWDQEDGGGTWQSRGSDAHMYATEKLLLGGKGDAARPDLEVT